MEKLQHESFSYFCMRRIPSTVGDRQDRGGLAGEHCRHRLALAAYPVAVERGFMPRVAAVERTLTTLRFFWNSAQGPSLTHRLPGLLLSFSRHADRPARLALRTLHGR